MSEFVDFICMIFHSFLKASASQTTFGIQCLLHRFGKFNIIVTVLLTADVYKFLPTSLSLFFSFILSCLMLLGLETFYVSSTGLWFVHVCVCV